MLVLWSRLRRWMTVTGDPSPIPLSAAEQIAKAYGYQEVVVYAHSQDEDDCHWYAFSNYGVSDHSEKASRDVVEMMKLDIVGGMIPGNG